MALELSAKRAQPATGIQFHSPEWIHFSRMLVERRGKLQTEVENLKLTPDDRLVLAAKLSLISELLGLPELQKREALAAAAFSDLGPDRGY